MGRKHSCLRFTLSLKPEAQQHLCPSCGDVRYVHILLIHTSFSPLNPCEFLLCNLQPKDSIFPPDSVVGTMCLLSSLILSEPCSVNAAMCISHVGKIGRPGLKTVKRHAQSHTAPQRTFSLCIASISGHMTLTFLFSSPLCLLSCLGPKRLGMESIPARISTCVPSLRESLPNSH